MLEGGEEGFIQGVGDGSGVCALLRGLFETVALLGGVGEFGEGVNQLHPCDV